MIKKDLAKDYGGTYELTGTELLKEAYSCARLGLKEKALDNLNKYFSSKNLALNENIYKKVLKIYRDEGLKVELQEKMKLYIKTLEKKSSRINPKGLEILIKELTEFKTLLELK